MSTVGIAHAYTSSPDTYLLYILLRPVQRGVQEWKARISILSLSDTPPPSSPSDPPSLTPHLCYACHTTLTSRSNRKAGAYTDDRMQAAGIGQVEMPVWVGATFGGAAGEVWRRRRMDMGEMKESVQEYLLGD
jgi:cytoplasmic tRNA 2-thiolation protein 2